MFQDPLQYYQAIASELTEVIREEWTSIEIEAVRYENSINLEIVYFRPDGSEESRVKTKMIPDYFFNLAKVVSREGRGLYKLCHFRLDSSGSFNVDFEY
ncbi:hypothetical protein [uncultured Microbulbifer sp.]|uniref:hypothetical protein n=1 Tax=uncultured Microbulbifer sp. TaxID=348147 RepID=UPI0025ED8DBC|nr:hypothetical protein [uncultured Microbulbifer sp.]